MTKLVRKHGKNTSGKNAIFEEQTEWAVRHGGKLDIAGFALDTRRTYDESFDAAETMRNNGLFSYDSRRLLYRMIIEKPANRCEKQVPRARKGECEHAAALPVPETVPAVSAVEAYEAVAQMPRRARRERRRTGSACGTAGAGFSPGGAVDVPVLDAYDGDAGDAVPEAYETAAKPESAGEPIQAAEPYAMQEPAVEPETEEVPSASVSLEEARRRIRRYFSDSGEEIIGWSDFRDIGVIKRHVERFETDGFLVREGSGFVLGNGSRHEEQAAGTGYDPDWLNNWRAMSEGKTVTARTRAQKPAAHAPERRRERLTESAEKRFANYFLEKKNGGRAAPKDELLAAGFTEDDIRFGIIGGALGIGNEGFVLSAPLLNRYKPEEPAPGGNGSRHEAPGRSYRGVGTGYSPHAPANVYERILTNLRSNGGTKHEVDEDGILALAGGDKLVVQHLVGKGYVRTEGEKRRRTYRMTQKGVDSLLEDAVR